VKVFLKKLLVKFPRVHWALSRLHQKIFVKNSVSSSYVTIGAESVVEESIRLRDSWQSELLPQRQRLLVSKQLEDYRQGKSIDVFDVIVKALLGLKLYSAPSTLLEIGCSSGFYSEVLDIKQLPFIYSGCDYSKSFVELGRQLYPSVPFYVADATKLDFEDSSFDVVISGCCLLHIPDFEKAIAETARVAKSFVIFHRTPVIVELPNQFFCKQAYGVETVEIHFNENELITLFHKYGLKLIKTFTISQNPNIGQSGMYDFNRTYVCQKVNDGN
jgi:ubiquinone/menaquinone biosynthesis C-methylase UbiE